MSVHKYFSIEEMCHSDTAIAQGITNKPTQPIIDSLDALIEHVLDPLREAYGQPIIVSSGYRCKRLNKAVGGVSNSQHLIGEAADISVRPKGDKKGNKVLFEYIRKNLPYDQLIWENGGVWVHVSYRKQNRHQCFSATKK